MEERKLNFNVPLLSVRRSSNTTKSSNGAKGKKIENPQFNRRHTLPPHKSDFSLYQVTEPVAVPFNWEQIPGRPKDDNVPDSRGLTEASVTPRFPPLWVLDTVKNTKNKKPEDRDVFRPQNEANSFKDIVVSRLDCLKEGANEKAGLNSENDDDDFYSDALDALPPTDSFSVNCSLSGVSGFDNQVVKKSETFSTDPQTRDFMMSRFLPAAKAMTLETPRYASRKQPVSAEQPRQITKVVLPDRKPPVKRNESLNALPYHQDIENEESENESDVDADSARIATKGCGLLPQLRIKNSLSLLNLVPGLKIRTQASMSSTLDGIKKLSKAAYPRSLSPAAKKPAKDSVYKQKVANEVLSPRLAGLSHASDRLMISRTSPFRRSGCVSPWSNQAPQSPSRGGRFLCSPKELEGVKAKKGNLYNKSYSKSQELVSYHGIRQKSCPVSPIVEKTLYVDTVNVTGLLCLKSDSSEVKKGCVDSTPKELFLLNSKEIQETAGTVSLSEDAKCLKFPRDMCKLEHKGLQSVDADLSHKGEAEVIEDLSQALICIRTASEGNLKVGSAQISDINSEYGKSSLLETPLPPVLPKTPSESWLWRTLPSISSQNRGTSFQNKKQDHKTSSTSSKWENIVKSSYLHSDHVRYSEELLPRASQQPNS